jgi:D-alanyl-lipoteichoic acid acyltransferase DltB (MBOAT superfamily)
LIVGCLRLLGFNVFRNTYKPLLAESIIEYWGRYSHYFKELCVDFFFYPTYLRCAWAGPRLRMFIAVFAAAFAGNMYFHILEESELLIEGDPAALWTAWGARMVYCLLLAFGVWVSMLRQQSRRATKSGTAVSNLTRIRRIAGVWTYYAIIHIWHIELSDVGPGERARFLAAAFGL